MSLSITPSSIVVDRSTNALRVYGKIVAAGSYTTGGDGLSFAGLDAIKSDSVPSFVSIQSQASGGASGFEYRFVPGTTMANGKMQSFGQQPTSVTSGIIALNEIAAAAYPAGITGDTIVFEAIFLFGQ
jgi:hypothetical protein